MEGRNQEQEDYRGISRKKKLVCWYSHFKNLLENPPEVLNEDEIIPMIFPELPIRTDAFDWDEYQAAKRADKEGNSFGEDGIAQRSSKGAPLMILSLNL